MSSMKDIKQRISNVSSAKQIIKAMDMVSSTKLYKTRMQLEGVRPIYFDLKKKINELLKDDDVMEHIFFKEQKVKSSLYIILTSNRGLAGSYNNNIIVKALEHMNQGKNEKIVVLGTKGIEYFNKSRKNIIRSFDDISDVNIYYGSEKFANWLTEYYLSGDVEEVYLVYTEFESVLSYVPKVEKLLPIESYKQNNIRADIDSKHNDNSNNESKGNEIDDYHRYEPSKSAFIDHIVPLYLHMSLFRAFSEAHTSEHAARMVNMDNAGKNASELIEDLTHKYNRKRQTAITQELSEIVGSANSLNKGGIHDK